MEKEMCEAKHHNFIQKTSEGVFHSFDKRDKLRYRQGIATREKQRSQESFLLSNPQTPK